MTEAASIRSTSLIFGTPGMTGIGPLGSHDKRLSWGLKHDFGMCVGAHRAVMHLTRTRGEAPAAARAAGDLSPT